MIKSNYTKSIWKEYLAKARRGEGNYYKTTDQQLYKALKVHPIEGKSVLVFGSVKPWYEAICFVYGGRSCTVSEHNVPEFDIIPNLKYIHVDDIEGEFDVGISISTFEHSGLGRYGDPIDPDGDLKAMHQAQTLIKPRGLLFLAIPISPDGIDTVIGNRHRIYGASRLSIMFTGWELRAQFGKKYHTSRKDGPDWYQPVFVLENERGKSCQDKGRFLN